jgi:uncharacterized 2Fe-2S/4Fe-4S cluster protein (DUF4445 family)
MPTLTVKAGDAYNRVSFAAGQSIREILDATDFPVRSGCRGTGACGLCRVKIEKGGAAEPSGNERIYISGAQLSSGVRLACQVRPEGDMEIAILNPAPKSNWKSLSGGMLLRSGRSRDLDRQLSAHETHPYGAAIDLGTTNISLSLFDLLSGKWLAERYGQNPQALYGSDVVTRLLTASESPDKARKMSLMAIEAIGEALMDIAARDGFNIKQIVYLAIAGNTAMLSLLSGRNSNMLLQPERWTNAVDCLPQDASEWKKSWGVHPQAAIEVVPPLAGFVGSDLLAGVVATQLNKMEHPALLIDFGTNSEIALWDGKILWATSAAGGPAFESSGISCGMPAETGAIYGVASGDGPYDFKFEVVGGAEPAGLCGSGLVDLIACLLGAGAIEKTGKFGTAAPEGRFLLVNGDRNIFLTKSDIDLLQRAKAAVGAGIKILSRAAAVGLKDLKRICIGGEFGKFLNGASAQAIGLLPQAPADIIERCGNISLLGCEDIMLSNGAADTLEEIRDKSRIINLSEEPDFEEMFFENLYLEPLREG